MQWMIWTVLAVGFFLVALFVLAWRIYDVRSKKGMSSEEFEERLKRALRDENGNLYPSVLNEIEKARSDESGRGRRSV